MEDMKNIITQDAVCSLTEATEALRYLATLVDSTNVGLATLLLSINDRLENRVLPQIFPAHKMTAGEGREGAQ